MRPVFASVHILVYKRALLTRRESHQVILGLPLKMFAIHRPHTLTLANQPDQSTALGVRTAAFEPPGKLLTDPLFRRVCWQTVSNLEIQNPN